MDVKWLNGCEMCNTGIYETIEEHKKDGLSVRAACEIMEEEASQKFPELKEDLTASRIRARYKRQMSGGTKSLQDMREEMSRYKRQMLGGTNRPTESDEIKDLRVRSNRFNHMVEELYTEFDIYRKGLDVLIKRDSKVYKKCEKLRNLLVELFPFQAMTKPEEKIDLEMQQAFDAFYYETQRVKMEHWKNTSKETALYLVELTKNLIEIS